MNDLLTLPPERDLPRAAAHRRRLVAMVAGQRRAPARITPAVAAAAAVLVAGGGIATATVFSGRGAVAPGAAPPDAYVEACLHNPAAPTPADTPPPTPVAGVPEPNAKVVFTDRYGQLALVGSRTDFRICALQADGRHTAEDENTRTNSGIDPAEIARRHLVLGGVDYGSELNVSGWGPPHKPFSYQAVGWVGPDVARVTVTWTGQRPVVASVGNGFFAARLVRPYDGHPPRELGFVARAYDVNGRQVAVVDNSRVPAKEPATYVPGPTS